MMETFLGYSTERLKALGGYHTAREITGQPQLWVKTWKKLREESGRIGKFLDAVQQKSDLEVVLTGAGTSAFVGDVAEPVFRTCWSKPVRAIPTTTLVTHFNEYIDRKKPLLLVSYARSGNSPESTGVIEIARAEMQAELFHLVITCNSNGRLAKMATGPNTCLFLLPEEAEDQGLAMTGSFSSMLLASLLIARLDKLNEKEDDIHRLADAGKHLIGNQLDTLKTVVQKDIARAVFLGSGSMLGIARESHLKLQELTDGKIVCKYDSFLGFRHGPEAVIDRNTLLVYLFSEDPYVWQYERDLAEDIAAKGFGATTLGIRGNRMGEDSLKIDYFIGLDIKNDNKLLDSAFQPIVSVLPAQIMAFLKSIQGGLEPDEPSEKGAITRVVEGVTIYPIHSHSDM